MADSWLSLARRDEAMDSLLASWDTAEPVKTDGLRLIPILRLSDLRLPNRGGRWT